MTAVDVAEEVTAAVHVLARHRIGALVLFDPAGVVEGGVPMDAILTRQLLVALFVPERLNRLHAGAVIIRRDRVELTAVPISWADVVGRAAELAAVVAVDEDKGEIRVMDRTGCVEVVEPAELADVLRQHALEAGRR